MSLESFVSILQMGKHILREVKSLAQGHRASNCQYPNSGSPLSYLLDKDMKWSQAVLLGVINNSVGRNAPRGGAGSLQQGAEDIIIKR